MSIARAQVASAIITFAALSAGACGCGGSDGPRGSVGAILGRDNDTHALYVRDVPEGLAADLGGLLPGDEIMMIDGVYARDLDKREITRKLRGEVGTEVDLTILRANEVLRLRVKRTPLREPDPVKAKEETVEP